MSVHNGEHRINVCFCEFRLSYGEELYLSKNYITFNKYLLENIKEICIWKCNLLYLLLLKPLLKKTYNYRCFSLLESNGTQLYTVWCINTQCRFVAEILISFSISLSEWNKEKDLIHTSEYIRNLKLLIKVSLLK